LRVEIEFCHALAILLLAIARWMIVDPDRAFELCQLFGSYPARKQCGYFRLQRLADGVYVGKTRLVEEEMGRQQLHGVLGGGCCDECAATRAGSGEDEALRLQRFHGFSHRSLCCFEAVDELALLRQAVAG